MGKNCAEFKSGSVTFLKDAFTVFGVLSSNRTLSRSPANPGAASGFLLAGTLYCHVLVLTLTLTLILNWFTLPCSHQRSSWLTIKDLGEQTVECVLRKKVCIRKIASYLWRMDTPMPGCGPWGACYQIPDSVIKLHALTPGKEDTGKSCAIKGIKIIQGCSGLTGDRKVAFV